MAGSEILEVAIGLVFIFLIASLVASTIRETIEAWLKTRAVHLERGLRQLLVDPKGTGVTKELFDHPLLFGLFPGQYEPGKQLTGFKMRAPASLLRRLLSLTPKPDAQAPDQRLAYSSNLPNYIPSRNFALALMDLVSNSGSEGKSSAAPLSLESIRAGAMALPEGTIRQAMVVALAEAGNDIDRARASIEAWFDGNMDRVSGWYKRETQWILLVIGLVIAAFLNVDALRIAHDLSVNNKLRQDVVAQAVRTNAEFKDNPALRMTEEQLRGQLTGLSEVIGWARLSRAAEAKIAAKERARREACGNLPLPNGSDNRRTTCEEAHPVPSHFGLILPHIPGRIPGWIITALAISLGAPFWFDLLNKFMVIRSTVKPYEKSPSEGSEDRAGAASPAAQLAPRHGAGSQSQGAGQAAAPPTPALVRLRLAIDAHGIDLSSLVVTSNGEKVAVMSENDVALAEVPLHVGESNSVLAEAKPDDGTTTLRRWTKVIVPTLNSEAEPMLAKLV
ncbi:hypothetical protein VQH23_03330 [Pararoseomonas sp. SCSIO 73927]|uniref:hypothetical protein n=1 Tax=Pararoseomonas sp. SCSIO 73927 TaxID=3114537 RepID=UPI0030D37771